MRTLLIYDSVHFACLCSAKRMKLISKSSLGLFPKILHSGNTNDIGGFVLHVCNRLPVLRGRNLGSNYNCKQTVQLA